ncbi:MAG: hypothetical protein QNJ72_42205 [Pleurocapsa sp. MO_226.B13]|nr:hypothetical protein [Pleurocapsa sp. MO_226.B13]
MTNTSHSPKREKCPYGFTCSKMTSRLNTIAEHCEYLKDCRDIKKSTSGSGNKDRNLKRFIKQNLELIEKIEQERQLKPQNQQKIKRLYRDISFYSHVIKHERSVSDLKKFANHQLIGSFGIYEQRKRITKSLQRISTQLRNFNQKSNLDRGYIAPSGVEVHTYTVKHPPSGKFPPGTSVEEMRKQQKIYRYHKLLSKTAQFTSETDTSKKCKVIHLGKSDNEKNIQARLGIERRNRLSKIRTLITQAAEVLQEAAELADEELCFDDFNGGYDESSD